MALSFKSGKRRSMRVIVSKKVAMMHIWNEQLAGRIANNGWADFEHHSAEHTWTPRASVLSFEEKTIKGIVSIANCHLSWNNSSPIVKWLDIYYWWLHNTLLEKITHIVDIKVACSWSKNPLSWIHTQSNEECNQQQNTD